MHDGHDWATYWRDRAEAEAALRDWIAEHVDVAATVNPEIRAGYSELERRAAKLEPAVEHLAHAMHVLVRRHDTEDHDVTRDLPHDWADPMLDLRMEASGAAAAWAAVDRLRRHLESIGSLGLGPDTPGWALEEALREPPEPAL